MAKALVTIAPEAVAESVKIAVWWNRNRPAAPRLFQIELDRAVLLIAEQPDIGRRIRGRGRANLRVLTLLRTRYLVFYEYLAIGAGRRRLGFRSRRGRPKTARRRPSCGK